MTPHALDQELSVDWLAATIRATNRIVIFGHKNNEVISSTWKGPCQLGVNEKSRMSTRKNHQLLWPRDAGQSEG